MTTPKAQREAEKLDRTLHNALLASFDEVDPRPDYYRGHHFRCDIWPGGIGHCTCCGPLVRNNIRPEGGEE